MKNQSAFREVLLQARSTSDYSRLTGLLPYARKIGMHCQSLGDDALFVLPENKENTGNPVLPALHGGVLGGFMEMSAAIHLMLFMDEPRIPKIVDFSIDYLRSSRIQDVFAECKVVRQGSRIANVSITAWQSRRETPVATARGNFRLDSN
ncbi:PaaI family thioesterase [Endozoicomonas numazuensis]|uniref:Thioesterase n=1 Tax=Endozoicomonas numazuensis TaxID=1137799 RepID=A0A081N3T2_9GAMM|nr:PaaI family thioesterase [Endozoicomonas numazuensis]KEQ13105.1 thioesterase [Endozoicomonas numazuensis]